MYTVTLREDGAYVIIIETSDGNVIYANSAEAAFEFAIDHIDDLVK